MIRETKDQLQTTLGLALPFAAFAFAFAAFALAFAAFGLAFAAFLSAFAFYAIVMNVTRAYPAERCFWINYWRLNFIGD